MNSTENHHCCELDDESERPGPSELTNADTNANLTNRSNSNCKGAIPKTKPAVKIKSNSSKKSIKLNNNVDEMSIITSAVQKDFLQVNGVSLNSNFTSRKEIIDTSIAKGDNINDHKCNSAILCDTLDSISLEPCNDRNKVKFKYCQLSDEEDEDAFSISDDGCIYTYKGDQDADLPNSFFSLDMPVESPNPINRRRNSSPEMDFLEMDFDPGPSSELDFENSVSNELEIINCETVKNDVNKSPITYSETSNLTNNAINIEVEKVNPISKSSTTVEKKEDHNTSLVEDDCVGECNNYSESNDPELRLKVPWTCNISDRTIASSNSALTRKYHCMKGELVSPVDNPQKNGTIFNSAFCDTPCIDCYHLEPLDNLLEFDAMIWTEQEAYLKQTTQIGPSACGATAVLNVLNALKLPVPSIEKVNACIKTRLRANSSPLAEYLLSRSVAGTTHKDIVDCLHKITDGQVYARFFPMYPERVVNLSSWLAFWISKGAVPIATLNLQKGPGGTIPDAWHHQMIFGANSKGICLCNPVECVAPEFLWPQLSSESILLVRREDVLSRWNIKVDLPELMKINNYRWRSINVVGQVANLIFESRRELRLGFKNTSHIKIPACYSSGITLAIVSNSSFCPLLRQCPELPILESSKQSAPNTVKK